MPEVIDMIDNCVSDWTDSMRWTPEPPPTSTAPLMGEAFITSGQVARMNDSLRVMGEQMTALLNALGEQLRPTFVAFNRLASQFPQRPVRGRPAPLAADGRAYRRRCLARRRRSN